MKRLFVLAATAMALSASVLAAQEKPNILVIWGDDIGQTNISAYGDGIVGYQTPNIDRIANEGMRFTDYYAEQSCTAGRSTFITGQTAFRTGLSKVGLPGAPQGMQEQDVTIAALLKEQGYATGQFGKNHLGDLDEHLPTNHGFDQFFGNLYHLNAEEEPENEDYPADFDMGDGRTFAETFGPRGVIRSSAVYGDNGEDRKTQDGNDCAFHETSDETGCSELGAGGVISPASTAAMNASITTGSNRVPDMDRILSST